MHLRVSNVFIHILVCRGRDIWPRLGEGEIIWLMTYYEWAFEKEAIYFVGLT